MGQKVGPRHQSARQRAKAGKFIGLAHFSFAAPPVIYRRWTQSPKGCKAQLAYRLDRCGALSPYDSVSASNFCTPKYSEVAVREQRFGPRQRSVDPAHFEGVVGFQTKKIREDRSYPYAQGRLAKCLGFV
jgi:hypothetical protein